MYAPFKIGLAAAFAALGLAQAAHAQTTIVGGSLFVTSSGDVMATYLGNSALYDDYLSLDSPTNSLGTIFFNHGDPVGTTKDLGTFTAGQELVFRLHVANTGDDFYSGDPSRNPDGHAHDLATYGYTPTSTRVDFEDLKGGPYDYNDLSFTFTNVQQVATVPEASPAALFVPGLGVLGLMLVARRRLSRTDQRTE